MIFQANISYFSAPAKDLDYSNLNLNIYIGPRIFCYAIMDSAFTIHAFEKYNLETNITDQLPDFLKAKNWLTKSFKTIKIAFGPPQTSMVPEKFYQKEDADKILALHYGDLLDTKNFADHHHTEQLYLLYGIPKEQLRTVLYNFPTANCHHYQSYLLRYCLQKKSGGHNLYIHFLEDVLVVVVLNKEQILFSKTFPNISSEDTIYQLLSICRLLEIPLEAISVYLSGWITKNSEVYNMLYKFIPELHFDGPENNLQIKNSEFDAHYFTIFEVLEQTI